MSSAISGIGAGSFLSQLQNMQRQMNDLATKSANPPFLAGINETNGSQVEANSLQSTQDTVELSQNTQISAQDKVGSFEQLLKDAFENVNNLQNEANNMQTRFDTGDRSVSLADVMLASQKSSISFEATVQVRNKLIEAYKTISQMQI